LWSARARAGHRVLQALTLTLSGASAFAQCLHSRAYPLAVPHRRQEWRSACCDCQPLDLHVSTCSKDIVATVACSVDSSVRTVLSPCLGLKVSEAQATPAASEVSKAPAEPDTPKVREGCAGPDGLDFDKLDGWVFRCWCGEKQARFW
jgi:hypothetical protein